MSLFDPPSDPEYCAHECRECDQPMQKEFPRVRGSDWICVNHSCKRSPFYGQIIISTKTVPIANANKRPDFICPRCENMCVEGNGGYAFGVWEWYFMACKKLRTSCGYQSIDAEADGPNDENNMTDIIVSCDGYDPKAQS